MLFVRDQINREEGLEEGRKEGVHNKSLEIAKKMIEQNEYTLQDIADITDLKLAEVEALANLQPV